MTDENTELETGLFHDLQQFIYDARDQFLALEHIRNDLLEIAETTVSQRRAVAETSQKLDRAIKAGVDVKINAGLDQPLQQLARATGELQSTVSSALRNARLLLYTFIAATLTSAFTGACAGLYAAVRFL